MKTLYTFFLTMMLGLSLQAQSLLDEVTFWVGQGQDSAIFVVDFNDSSDFESYAWGVLFDGSIDGLTLIQTVAAADPGFSFAENNGFLNDIIYNNQEGIGGQPDFWSTWDGADMGNLATNLGLSTTIGPDQIFACSYTDFNPATYPDTPVAAPNPFAFTFADVTTWIGSGADSSVLVIDFNDSSAIESYAWGFLYDGSTTGEDMLNAIVAADPSLAIVVNNGFLSDITYNNQAGIGGQPDFWSTWNGTNMADWTSNLGLSTAVAPGEFFGCSYTDFNPAIPPSTPVAAGINTGIASSTWKVDLFPNPASSHITVQTDHTRGNYVIYLLNGQIAQSGQWQPQIPIAIDALPTGQYILQLMNSKGRYQTSITKL